MDEARTEFDYLLNRYTRAAQAEKPAAENFREHTLALFAYVRDLERKVSVSQDDPVARVDIGLFGRTDAPWFEMIEGKTLPDGVHDLYLRPQGHGEPAFNAETQDQIASVMLQYGTPAQQAEALRHVGVASPASGDAVRQALGKILRVAVKGRHEEDFTCIEDTARAALLSLDAPKDAAVGAWRPIEEAPTDGTRILLGVFPTRGMASGQTEIDYYHLATWDGEHSHPYVPNNWTHFQYLPPPPGSGEGEGT